MASGWNYVWGESWKEYIQRSTITGDLERAQQQSTREMVGAISGHTASILTGMNDMGGQLSASMDRGFAQVGASMDRGFAELGGQMEQIAGEIADLNASFQWGFGQMIAQMGGMNDSLNTLIMLAREEVQRLAYNHFEIARDAFRRQLYEDCLEELGKAISGDHVSSGYKLEWRFHQMQGVVRLGFFGCEPLLVDPAQAEQSFLLAAKYARADFPEEAAKAFLSAGWAAFVQGRLSEALKYTDQAVSTDSKLVEALFQAAKFRMADGRPGDALPLLRSAIIAAPDYVVKVSADGDCQRHQAEIDTFLELVRDEQFRVLAPTVRAWLTEADAWASTVAEVAACTDELGRWRSLLEGGWGLLDLLKYSLEGAGTDHLKVVNAHDAGLKRMDNTWQFENRWIKVEKLVDEEYEAPEEYWEKVVLRPAGFFRKEKLEYVKKTRPVTKMRRVMRQVEVETLALLNLLREKEVVLWEAHFRFVRIPDGEFWMGSTAFEKDRWNYVVPHRVTLKKPFELMTTLVTQSLWESVMGSNPSKFKKPDRPVETVSWDDVQKFISKLNKMFGVTCFRLPTEAEWEYACRAGKAPADYGDLDGVAWYRRNSRDETHPVGQKLPNSWGLYDMLGNVREWCQDWYDSSPTGDAVDPVGPASGSDRVCRGGSWKSERDLVRADRRDRESPIYQSARHGTDGVIPSKDAYRGADLGFRLARSLS